MANDSNFPPPASNPYQSSPPASIHPPAGRPTMTLRRIDPLSCGKMLGTLYALLGLLVSVLGLVATLAGSNAGAGLLIVLAAPILYGIGGLIGGILLAALYNLCASLVGGIEMHWD